MQALLDHYATARSWINGSPYLDELMWQQSLALENLKESNFLREYAWVVLNSGFKESVIRKNFDFISLCFCDWEAAEEIASRQPICANAAFAVFRNRKKLAAIEFTAAHIASVGFKKFFLSIQDGPEESLQQLPYMGPVTALHLAKNIGADVIKPDRHLVRLAARFGYESVWSMCKDISNAFGDRMSVTDLVLWRFEERTFA